MNPSIPPIEPFDEHERELARILRALPGGEPSAQLDARILKSAANAAATSRRPALRWLASSGALWGIGGAAAAVLALGVSWHSMFPMPRSSNESQAPAAAMSDQESDASVPVQFQDRQAPEASAAPPPPPTLDRPSRSRIGATAAAPPPAQVQASPEPFAADHLDEHVANAASAEADSTSGLDKVTVTGSRMRSDSAASEAQKSAQANRDEERSVAPVSQGALGASSAAVAAGAAPTAESASAEPASWLAEIRYLRSQHRTAEAKASLIEFRKHYPDAAIPSDLAPLLRN